MTEVVGPKPNSEHSPVPHWKTFNWSVGGVVRMGSGLGAGARLRLVVVVVGGGSVIYNGGRRISMGNIYFFGGFFLLRGPIRKSE
jgi:hypothetical protein